MRYEKGKLILDDDETEFLSMVAMKKADREYLATEFIISRRKLAGIDCV